jgi:tRNA (guanine-N7-)-methyltransferase
MQRVIPIESPNFLREEELPQPVDWRAVFGNDNPLALEIGCGVGDFVAKTAQEHPDWNFIALDYYNKGCLKTCKRIDGLGLTNVRVLRAEARQFAAERLTPGSLTAVYINCPDPWPKQRHRKRRLVQRPFVDFMDEFLLPGGHFYFATDFDDYGRDVADFMTEVTGYVNQLEPDTYRHDIPGYHRTKYMRKFMAEGKDVFFVHYRKSGYMKTDHPQSPLFNRGEAEQREAGG